MIKRNTEQCFIDYLLQRAASSVNANKMKSIIHPSFPMSFPTTAQFTVFIY